MSTNPYASPPPDPSPALTPDPRRFPPGLREELQAVATYQRYVLWCLLFQLIVYFGGGPAVRSGLLTFPIFQALLGLVSLAGMVCAMLLAIRVYGIVLGIIVGLLTVVPCLGFLLLVLVNQRATAHLEQHGISVGLMGADPNSI